MNNDQTHFINNNFNRLYKKLLSEKNRTIEELERTQLSLQKNIPKAIKKPNISRAALAFSLLEDLIDECIYDVLFDVHRDIKKQNSICQICQTKFRKPGFDIWGNSYTLNNLPSYECVNCQKMIAASRYAPHLEKCLGLSGSRQSSRVANRRLGNSPSFSSDDNSPDSDYKRENSYCLVKKLKYGTD
ncbi:uncharacterized protein BX663DRAFT_525396 [Cokeromyces recurvatus]|uniref:uncharacterized protein n=1 Tax=Cokeromyces recurvatus TaxID=90255 RepID=UPI002220F3B7|nr:uncharacterized protein BX663DRAFT_525396 [Cokeromyces recurvatus]KAI7898314.1 hypothetical protein BX663DRAFT_525396 [Cokeromyces recurvatus]